MWIARITNGQRQQTSICVKRCDIAPCNGSVLSLSSHSHAHTTTTTDSLILDLSVFLHCKRNRTIVLTTDITSEGESTDWIVFPSTKERTVKENWNKFPKTVKRSWIKQVTTVTELNYLLEQDTFLHHYFSRVIYTSNSSHPAKHYIYNTEFCLSQSDRHNFIISWSIWLLHVSSEESHFHFWAHILLCGIPKAIVLRSHCQFVKDHGIFTFRALLQIFTHHSVLCQYLIGQWAARPFGL